MALPSSQDSPYSSDDVATSSNSEYESSSRPDIRQRRSAHPLHSQPRQNGASWRTHVSQSQQPAEYSDLSSESNGRHMSQKHPLGDVRHGSRSSSHKRRKPNAISKHRYRNLFNETVQDLVTGSAVDADDMISSQVGASSWHSWEKEAFFQSLAIRGLRDLPALGRAVPTKSQSEIRAYILLLQDAVEQPSTPGFVMADTWAAAEISAGCEAVLEVAADALENHVDTHEVELEQQRFGDSYWLVDEEQAAGLEVLLAESASDTSAAIVPPVTQPVDFKDGGDVSQNEAFLNSPAVALLRPLSFLQLSRQLFMNNSADDNRNWHYLASESTNHTEPAIYRSALDDLYDLTLTMTRRLVQAAIFQALTRLRAQDSARSTMPIIAVRKVDVDVASVSLQLPLLKDYWPCVARRCHVEVLSDSKRFNDGRPETKSGIRGRLLTYDEVEAEMGLSKISSPTALDAGLTEADIDATMDQDWLFTDTSDKDSDPVKSEDDTEGLSEGSWTRDRKRKRSSKPSSFYRNEERYLEGLDRRSAFQEEQKLLISLGQPSEITTTEVDKLPISPGSPPEAEKGHGSWDLGAEYEADWEQSGGHVPADFFEKAGIRGNSERHRRYVLMKEVRKRLAEGLENFSDNSAESEVISDAEHEEQPVYEEDTLDIDLRSSNTQASQ